MAYQIESYSKEMCPVSVLKRDWVDCQDFARLPWQNQPSQQTPAPAGPPPASNLSAQAMYGVPPSTGSITNGGGSQPSMTSGGITQAGDLSADELDIRAQSPLSISSTTSAGVGDVTARQTQDSSLILNPFPGISTSALESGGVEATSVLKVGLRGKVE
jgi:hypothetical protein